MKVTVGEEYARVFLRKVLLPRRWMRRRQRAAMRSNEGRTPVRGAVPPSGDRTNWPIPGFCRCRRLHSRFTRYGDGRTQEPRREGAGPLRNRDAEEVIQEPREKESNL